MTGLGETGGVEKGLEPPCGGDEELLPLPLPFRE